MESQTALLSTSRPSLEATPPPAAGHERQMSWVRKVLNQLESAEESLKEPPRRSGSLPRGHRYSPSSGQSSERSPPSMREPSAEEWQIEHENGSSGGAKADALIRGEAPASEAESAVTAEAGKEAVPAPEAEGETITQAAENTPQAADTVSQAARKGHVSLMEAAQKKEAAGLERLDADAEHGDLPPADPSPSAPDQDLDLEDRQSVASASHTGAAASNGVSFQGPTVSFPHHPSLTPAPDFVLQQEVDASEDEGSASLKGTQSAVSLRGVDAVMPRLQEAELGGWGATLSGGRSSVTMGDAPVGHHTIDASVEAQKLHPGTSGQSTEEHFEAIGKSEPPPAASAVLRSPSGFDSECELPRKVTGNPDTTVGPSNLSETADPDKLGAIPHKQREIPLSPGAPLAPVGPPTLSPPPVSSNGNTFTSNSVGASNGTGEGNTPPLAESTSPTAVLAESNLPAAATVRTSYSSQLSRLKSVGGAGEAEREGETSVRGHPRTGSRLPDFEFAFDNPTFSDRSLMVELNPEAEYKVPAPEGDPVSSEQALLWNELLCQSSTHSDPLKPGGTANCGTAAPPLGPTMKQLHVCSAILAVKSPFFLSLFSQPNGRDAVVTIKPEDEQAFLDVLRYAYNRQICAQSHEAVARVLVLSDHFEMESCFRHCVTVLEGKELDVVAACMYIGLQTLVKDVRGLDSLLRVARNWLTKHFHQFDGQGRTPDFFALSILGLEVVLDADTLIVQDEAVVFNALITWLRHHYPGSLAQRQKVVGLLGPLVRFPWMTPNSLKAAMDVEEMGCSAGRALVVEALFFKAEPVYKQQLMARSPWEHSRYSKRTGGTGGWTVWKQPQDEDHRQVVVTWTVPLSEFWKASWTGPQQTQPFTLGDKVMVGALSRGCRNSSRGPHSDVTLTIAPRVPPTEKFAIEYAVQVRLAVNGRFSKQGGGKATFKKSKESPVSIPIRIPADSSFLDIHIILTLV